MIKPDAISKRLTGVIIDRLERLGLDIKGAKVRVMTEDLAREHYSNLAGQPFLPGVISFMRGDFNGIADHRIYAFVFEGAIDIAMPPRNSDPLRVARSRQYASVFSSARGSVIKELRAFSADILSVNTSVQLFESANLSASGAVVLMSVSYDRVPFLLLFLPLC